MEAGVVLVIGGGSGPTGPCVAGLLPDRGVPARASPRTQNHRANQLRARLAGQRASPAHPNDHGLRVVAKLLRYLLGTALASGFMGGRGGGIPP